MYAFLTSGTKAFLSKLIAKHPEKNILFIQSGTGGTVYYEDESKKSIFQAGKTYDVLSQDGKLAHIGIIVMHHLKILDDEAPAFESKAHQVIDNLNKEPRILATRLLKTQKTNEYILFSQWPKEEDFKSWQDSVAGSQLDFDAMAKTPAYFANRPYTLVYYMVDEDD